MAQKINKNDAIAAVAADDARRDAGSEIARLEAAIREALSILNAESRSINTRARLARGVLGAALDNLTAQTK